MFVCMYVHSGLVLRIVSTCLSHISSSLPLHLSQEFRDKAALLADAKRTSEDESKSSAARNGAAFHSDDDEEEVSLSILRRPASYLDSRVFPFPINSTGDGR